MNNDFLKSSPVGHFRYSMAVTQETVSNAAPILFRGDVYRVVEDAAQIGYDAVELQLRDADKYEGSRLADHCAEQGCAISGLATGLEYSLNHLSMISNSARIRRKMLTKLKQHVDLAHQLGCMVIIGCVRGNLPDGEDNCKYMEYFVSGLLDVLEYAAAKDVVIAVEAINYYVNNYLNTVKETCDFIAGIGMDNLKLHIDTHHMNIEDHNPIQSILDCKDQIGYVHFAEINRMHPGAGNYDFKTVMAALTKIKYQGYISLECIPKPDAYNAAESGLKYLKSLESSK